MNITHTVALNAPPEKVWAVLADPNEIAECIPGCEGLNPLGGGQYEAVLRVGVGAVRGTFRGKISLRDQQPPVSYRLAVEGQGAAGVVNGEGLIRLTPEGGATVVTVEGDATVGGAVAAVGQRMLTGAARMLMTQFFDNVGRKVAAGQ